MLKVTGLTTEHLIDPIGIDASVPRLSWKLESDHTNIVQKTRRILAYSNLDGTALIWDSGEIISSDSLYIPWNGPKLCSRQRIYWKVRVTAESVSETLSESSAESSMAFFEMGLLAPADWTAKWIWPETEVDITAWKPAPYLRKEFTVGPGLVQARIYHTAHGLYDFRINGKPGCDEVFKPGFTSYLKRLQYQVHDITAQLQQGTNCWSVILGDGWWRGIIGGTQTNSFGYKLAYLGQLELTYADGHREVIETDETFRTVFGGIRRTDMKRGELYDASFEPEGWQLAGYDDSGWQAVLPETDEYADPVTLIASQSVPIREKEAFIPKILRTPDGSLVFDFGQNIAGYVRAHFRNLKKGQKITMVYCETLDRNGNPTQNNFLMEGTIENGNCQRTTFISDGKAEADYAPLFSVFGFRYVQVIGIAGTPDPEDFRAVAVYSDTKPAGKFSCSDQRLNQLTRNALWSQKGNFLDVPTDCPQRERSPWVGDAQIYCSTAARFMDVYSFFEKWMLDVRTEQYPSGVIANTVPGTNGLKHYPPEEERVEREIDQIPDPTLRAAAQVQLGNSETGSVLDGSSGWADAAVIIPYNMYLCYGDRRILENQYDTAKKWVDYIIKSAKCVNPEYRSLPWYAHPEDACLIWDIGFHWGEWLEADQDGYGENGDAMTLINQLMANPDYLSATTYYFYSAKLLSRIADILGKAADAAYYAEIAAQVKAVYNRYFIPESGIILPGRQAIHARVLFFDLCEEKKKPAVAAYLNRLLVENDYCLNTGFLSTPYLLPILVQYGYLDTAYRVLMQEKCPNWLYSVSLGATTIPETWTAFRKLDSSLNHYSYGAVCEFFFSEICGIKPIPEKPGYQEFLLEPKPHLLLDHAEAEQDSPYGCIRSNWKKQGSAYEYEFTIPANTRAYVTLSCSEDQEAKIRAAYPAAIYAEGQLKLLLGSGTYRL